MVELNNLEHFYLPCIYVTFRKENVAVGLRSIHVKIFLLLNLFLLSLIKNAFEWGLIKLLCFSFFFDGFI